MLLLLFLLILLICCYNLNFTCNRVSFSYLFCVGTKYVHMMGKRTFESRNEQVLR